MMLLTAWMLLVMPAQTASMPNPREFLLEAVSFASADDCDAAGRKWGDDLANEAYKPHDRREPFLWGLPRTAPADVIVTFSCVER